MLVVDSSTEKRHTFVCVDDTNHNTMLYQNTINKLHSNPNKKTHKKIITYNISGIIIRA